MLISTGSVASLGCSLRSSHECLQLHSNTLSQGSRNSRVSCTFDCTGCGKAVAIIVFVETLVASVAAISYNTQHHHCCCSQCQTGVYPYCFFHHSSQDHAHHTVGNDDTTLVSANCLLLLTAVACYVARRAVLAMLTTRNCQHSSAILSTM
jgi:hypothetical protein